MVGGKELGVWGGEILINVLYLKKSTYSKKEVAHFLGALLKVTLSGWVGAEC